MGFALSFALNALMDWPGDIVNVRLDDRILALAQGLTTHALANDPMLNVACEALNGHVVRVTSARPYLSFFVLFVEGAVEFTAHFEGNITARLDCDLMPFLKAVYAPAFMTEHSLEDCLHITQEPEVSACLVQIVKAWDLWNLLQTLGAEFIPFLGGDNELALELNAFKKSVDTRLAQLIQLQSSCQEHAAHQSALLKSMQLELKRLGYLVLALLLGLVIVVGCMLWLVFI